MSWQVNTTGYEYRISWEDEAGTGLTIGEALSKDESDTTLLAIYKAVEATGAEKDYRGYFWESANAAKPALRLVRAVEKAEKAKQPAICPCCKRAL